MNLAENIVLFGANGFFQKLFANGRPEHEIPVAPQFFIGGLSATVMKNPVNYLD